ncbi:hypothetical protein GGX14DRAFT_673717 [Mycena pura]|uniref:Uncharacterized protein n=1 Tax=Mycena pura TaxID=153505 RepID=A0AAD6Y4D8_9AGAR|nr:hypothetical protein GGX14DRAFT_673717 [Mycena pura]
MGIFPAYEDSHHAYEDHPFHSLTKILYTPNLGQALDGFWLEVLPLGGTFKPGNRYYDAVFYAKTAPRSSLQGFDSFYGSDDFAHLHNFHTTVVKQDSELVCHSEQVVIRPVTDLSTGNLSVVIIQQEMAKKIITEQICEVEILAQTVVFQQYLLCVARRLQPRPDAQLRAQRRDNEIVPHYGDMYNSGGSLSTYDYGFSGSDIGSNYYVPTCNWDDSTSPSSVSSAYQASQAASYY